MQAGVVFLPFVQFKISWTLLRNSGTEDPNDSCMGNSELEISKCTNRLVHFEISTFEFPMQESFDLLFSEFRKRFHDFGFKISFVQFQNSSLVRQVHGHLLT